MALVVASREDRAPQWRLKSLKIYYRIYTTYVNVCQFFAMKCARLRLQERPRTKPDPLPIPVKEAKPRRYCQKRMVDPAHEEDPRWIDIFQRYHCKKSFDHADTIDSGRNPIENQDDICLTVQNLKFQGQVQDTKRPRTSFKYKLPSDSKRHRMFVKQVVEDIDADDDLSSQLTSYYFDDYVKYILNNDRSRPSSSKSSLFLQTISNKGKESKAVQVETKTKETKKVQKDSDKHNVKTKPENHDSLKENNIDDAKVAFHKSGKRKSLTISRVPSPETVQVIRVDVVCNYSTSSILSDYCEDNKKYNKIDMAKLDKIDDIDLKRPHFSNKYLLTNTVKTLDENVSGGAKVTLLCKTFKLSDRLKLCSDRKNTKMTKDGTKLRK